MPATTVQCLAVADCGEQHVVRISSPLVSFLTRTSEDCAQYFFNGQGTHGPDFLPPSWCLLLLKRMLGKAS